MAILFDDQDPINLEDFPNPQTYQAPPAQPTSGTGAPIPLKDNPPPPGDDGGGGGGGGGGATAGFGGGFPGGRPEFNFGPAPVFDPGPGFAAPSMQDAQNEPGYQFRLQSGSDALERSAAARGSLRTGGTLRDLVEYGQNFGSAEYGRTFERAAGIYDRNYQGRRDAFAPRLADWSMRSGAETSAGLAAYQRAWDQYTFGHLSAAQQAANHQNAPMEPPPDEPPPL